MKRPDFLPSEKMPPRRTALLDCGGKMRRYSARPPSTLLFFWKMTISSQARSPGPDLRSWLATLEAHGEVRHITTEVDWNQEIGAIARVNLGLQGPGLLF